MITVYHRTHSESEVPCYSLAALVEVPHHLIVVDDKLDRAFESTNHWAFEDADWTKNLDVLSANECERSTSVGDLMELDGKLWRVAPCGFERMTRGFVKLDGVPYLVAEDGSFS